MIDNDRPAVPTSVISAIGGCRSEAVAGFVVASQFRSDLSDRGVTWIDEVVELKMGVDVWISKHRMTLAHLDQREVLSLDWFGVGSSYAESIDVARTTFAAAQIGAGIRYNKLKGDQE